MQVIQCNFGLCDGRTAMTIDTIRRNRSFLGLLGKQSTPTAQFNSLVRTATKDQLRSLYECVLNIVRRTVQLSPAEESELIRFRSFLYQLIDRSTPDSQKRELIVQHGGILPAIVAPILAAIAGGVASSVASKYI